MALTYAVLGSGAMGLRFWAAIKRTPRCSKWILLIRGKSKSTRLEKQGGVYQSRDGKNRHLIPISIQTPEEYQGKPDVFYHFLINKCICHSCSNEVSISSTKINMFSQE